MKRTKRCIDAVKSVSSKATVEPPLRKVKLEFPQIDVKLEEEVNQSLTSIKQEEDEYRKIDHIKVEIENKIVSPNVFPYVDKEHETIGPNNWSQIYNDIVNMRKLFMAPVDTQGCERMPNTINPNIKERNPRTYRFQLLISLMLSSQTKDEVNYDAMMKLHHGMMELGHKEGLTLEAIKALSEAEIDTYINKVGFHNRKSVYIKKTCEMLEAQFNGDIPKTIEEIVQFPGVGPKMGYLLLQNGWNINSGIGVDVHLHRLAQMWGWVPKNSKSPEHTRLELEKWLPEKYWADINPLTVGFGQVICPSVASNCDICSLATKGLCKSSNKKLLKFPLSDERKAKLMKSRADLSELMEYLEA
ncbi:DNA glycosylase [Scheffersomyces coipomensis]|uniref:DNA glycosylase n=1 Tax=Scheffersomyces coipomensis TaxID=1788519 RepID=UPI00315CF1CD